MKQSHYLIACACVVSLGIGYVAGGIRASSASGDNPKEEAANPRQMKSTSRDRQSRESSGDELLAGILKGRSAADLSDGELVKILRQLSKYDSTLDPVSSARKNYQLQLLLAKLPVSRLEQVAEVIASDPEAKRDGGLNKILGAMASKDPLRALAWAKTQQNPANLMASVLGIMARNDPMKAADLYREGLLDGTFSQYNGWQATVGIGKAMARLGKKALLNYMDSLPRQQQSNLLSNCFSELPESERMEMMDEIHQRSKDGRIQEWNLKNAFSTALFADRAQAAAWLEKMEPGKQRATLELYAASQFAQYGDSDAAKDWMARAIAQSQGREKELLDEAIDQMDYNSPGTIAVFASLLPESVEIKAEDLKNQTRSIAYSGFSGLTDLAGAIRDPAEQTKLITTALEQLASHIRRNSELSRVNAADYEIFTRQLQKLNLTGENATKVAEALAAAQSATPKPKE